MEGEFTFTGEHIHGTIGDGNERVFRILYDSEADRLNHLRNVARVSWANASSYQGDSIPESAGAAPRPSVMDNSVAEDFFDQ